MNESPVFTRIRQKITDNPVVLFMKGTPMFPQCGFSAAVVQALTNMGVKFKGIDVLSDPGLREGIKQFTNWPTIPQLYVGGAELTVDGGHAISLAALRAANESWLPRFMSP